MVRAFINFLILKWNEVQDLRYEHKLGILRESRHCEACDNWQRILETERAEKHRLISLLAEKPEVSEERIDVTDMKPVRGHIPWRVRQQMLEHDSLERAEKLKQAANE